MKSIPVRSLLLVCLLVTSATSAQAQVVRLEITSREPMNGGQPVGAVGPFELIRGKVHGEIDPRDPHNTIIQDLELAPRNARGRVEYVATFALAKPVDMARAARVLLYQVVNRGNGQAVASPEGYISLVSGWQGDVVPTAANQTIAVPVARNRDGSAITGPVLARFYDVPDGPTTAPIRLASLGPAQPYLPAGLEQPDARLTWHTRESYAGERDSEQTVPRGEWAFANCESMPWPGTPNPTRICLKDGFRADRLYQLVYTARDPLVLGAGLAATRDIVSFFRHARTDSAGTPNPVAGAIDHVVSIGDSQSGNFIRTFIHLGFNGDLQDRIVWDGAFPRIAARQTPMNLRFALPGGAAGLFEPGSDGVVWWTRYEDRTRRLPAAGLLDRCTATKTCPKIMEAFGSAEFWGLRMSPNLVGTDAAHDLPLPDNVRRYYFPGTTHGGGRGGFQVDPTPNKACVLPANPNPIADQTRALTRALVEWVTRGTPPPDSRYPRLADGDLVPATRQAIGYPAIPGLPFNDRVLNPVVRYDFGPEFRAVDVSGKMSIVPPRVLGVLPTYVPRVNDDGNETSGVPSVLMQAPLGTYLGWNVYRSGFFAGQGCGFQGGWIPFAKTRAERLAGGDPRPSLEERYGTPLIPDAKLRTLASAAIAACDKDDGLEDGLIGDPRTCRFDPAVLACRGEETDACLTPRQIDAVKKVYAGARTRSGRLLYPGPAPGSEAGWGQYITTLKEPLRVGLFRDWVFRDPSWDPRAFDWDKDVATVDAKYPFLNAMSTDYNAFRARGGKLIMFTGLADPVVSPLDTFAYYEAVAGAMGGMDATRSFFRFFPAPGMAHSAGGAGPNTFDALAALEAWVEHGTAPDSIPASQVTDGRAVRTRPLCAYPAVPQYAGTGSVDDAANFRCVSR